MMEFV
jgi:hypothetical protein